MKSTDSRWTALGDELAVSATNMLEDSGMLDTSLPSSIARVVSGDGRGPAWLAMRVSLTRL